MLLSILLATFVIATHAPARDAQALRRAHVPLPVGVTALVDSRACGGGCVFYPAGPVLVSPALPRRERLYVIFAELGHLFDWRVLSASDRVRYLALRGLASTTPWFAEGRVADPPGTPTEDFSEDYALCALGDPHRLPAVCSLVSAAAARAGERV